MRELWHSFGFVEFVHVRRYVIDVVNLGEPDSRLFMVVIEISISIHVEEISVCPIESGENKKNCLVFSRNWFGIIHIVHIACLRAVEPSINRLG